MPLPDYPSPPGNKPHSIHIVTGLASYVAVVTGATPTGGQAITAAALGLVSIEAAFSGGSDNGQYLVNVILPANPSGRGVSSVILQWITAATGAEVAGAVDLSGRTVRLTAIGS